MRLPLAACFILLCLHLNAQTTYTSNGVGGGDWDTNTTWSPVGIPGSSDEVIIADGDVVTVTGADKEILNLTLQGTGNLDFGADLAIQVNNDLLMTGSSSVTGTSGAQDILVIGNFNVTSGTASFGGFSFNIPLGTTTIQGTLEFTSSVGAKNMGDVVIDGGTLTYTVNERVNMTSLEMRDGAAITGNSNGQRVDIDGAFNITSGSATIGGNRINANGTTTINGALTFNNSVGNKTFNDVLIDGGTVAFDVNETFDVTGDLEMRDGASFTGSSNNHRVNIAGAFNITSGTSSIGGIGLNANGQTNISATLDFTIRNGTKNFNNVLIDGGTITYSDRETVAIAGNLEMRGGGAINGGAGNEEVVVTGQFNVTSGTATIGGGSFTANGQTTIDGTLSFTETSGVKSFNDIVVNGTGIFDNSTVAEDFVFTGSLTNNGTWNGCSNTNGCVYEMQSTTGTFSGTNPFNVTDLVIEAPASYTNNGTISITDNITGTGVFVNGATGILELSDNGAYTVSTFTLNTVGSVVRYIGGINEVIDIGPFYDLEIEMDNATARCVVNGSDVVVEGDLTIIEGDFRVVGINTLDVSGDALVQGGEFFINNNDAVVAITGDLDISGAGVFDINNGTVSFTDMEITSGGTAEVAGGLTFTSTGTVTVTNGTFTVDGAGTPTFNNISVGASGVWNVTAAYDPTINGNIHNIGTFTGCNALGCDYTLNNVSGTITGSAPLTNVSDVIIADGATYTNTNTGGLHITDRLRDGAGTATFVNGANGLLVYEGTTSDITIANFTANAINNTVVYSFTGANQDLPTPTGNTYYNLTIDGEDTNDAIMNSALIVDGTLTLGDGDVVLGDNDLSLGIDGNVVGGGLTGYLRQNGAGRVIKEYTTGGSASTINLPIGDNTVYAPMTFALVDSDAIPASAEFEFEYTSGGHPDRNNDNSASDGDDDGTAATDYLNGYWNFTSSTISNPTFNATLDYTNVGVTGSEAGLQPFLLRTFTPEGGGSTIDWFGIGSKPSVGSGTVNPTSNIVTFSNVVMGNTDGDDIGNTSNSVTLYAMDNSGSRLPITLIDFTAKVSGSVVQLDWSTASETNNEYFTIERSSDGSNFHAVLTVDGAGNSSGVIDYQAIDPFPMNGRTYYRLKQTDFNGQFEYSKLVAVDFHGLQGEHDFALIKNPVQNGETVYLEFSESLSAQPITVQMINGSGRVEQQLDKVVDSTLEMQLSSPKKSGLYIIQVISSQGRISKKLIVQ